MTFLNNRLQFLYLKFNALSFKFNVLYIKLDHKESITNWAERLVDLY